MSNCEFVTFPLVSWVRCGTWLYRFLIFASWLTLRERVSNWVLQFRLNQRFACNFLSTLGWKRKPRVLVALEERCVDTNPCYQWWSYQDILPNEHIDKKIITILKQKHEKKPCGTLFSLLQISSCIRIVFVVKYALLVCYRDTEVVVHMRLWSTTMVPQSITHFLDVLL